MSHRILAFEADAEFSRALTDGFSSFDVELQIVPDGPEGLDAAKNKRPDLILLSIELPTNGFRVCKKIKKDADLKEIPLIILSSESNADEIFQQHQKLSTRAEDYVKKPIEFDGLMEHVKSFVELAEAIPSEGGVDDEIDAFADDAFDALMVSEEEEEAANAFEEEDRTVMVSMDEVAMQNLVDPPSIPPAARTAPPSVPPISEPATPPSIPPEAAAPEEEKVDSLRLELEAAKQEADKAASLKTRADAAEAKVSALEAEVAQLKAGGGGGGGVSSREFLDLREKLNTKDKEILDLRDQVSARDKELVELRDSNISAERKIADSEDKLLAVQRELETLKESEATLKQSESSLKAKETELEGLVSEANAKNEKFEADLASLRAEKAAALSDAEERLKTAQEEADQSLGAKTRELETERESALANLRKELEELAEGALTARVAELNNERDAALAEKDDAHERELAVLGRKLADSETSVASAKEESEVLKREKSELEAAKEAVESELRGNLEALQAQLEDASQAKAALEATLEKAKAKIADDDALLERTRRAMSIGLSLLEDQKKNTFEA